MKSPLPSLALPVPTVTHGYPMLYADLDCLLAAGDAGFEAGFNAFVSRLEQAFQAEEQWIEERALDVLKEHRELHAEVLRLMHHAQARNMEGDYALARKVINLLPTWFNAHVPHMDQPLQAQAAEARKQAAPVQAQGA